MKILHFMPENYVWGGIEVYLKHTLPMLQQSGAHEICAVVTQDSQLFHALKEAGIPVWGIPFPLRKKSLLRSIWVNPWARCIDLSVYWHLIPILHQVKPDLVHVHNGRIEQSLIKWAGFPMVYTYHGYAGPFNIEKASNALAQLIYKLARPLFRGLLPALSGMTIVSHSEKARLYREKFAPSNFKMEVIHNGLPSEAMRNSLKNFSPQAFRQALNIPENAQVISYVCQLRRDKNTDAFLRIARRVAAHPALKRPVYFLVAGDGKYAPEFKKAFSQDPLLSRCGQYLGFRSDVAQIIAASDLTMSTSLQEGFGLRILESLLLGKPCVTYAAGGIPEVMDLPEAQEWLIPVGDEDAFVEGLIHTLNRTEQKLGELSPILQQHAEQFNLAQHVEKMESFYNRIMTAKLTANSIAFLTENLTDFGMENQPELPAEIRIKRQIISSPQRTLMTG
jgi:glycosyltransferase involved in cell wall biosynthesis